MTLRARGIVTVFRAPTITAFVAFLESAYTSAVDRLRQRLGETSSPLDPPRGTAATTTAAAVRRGAVIGAGSVLEMRRLAAAARLPRPF